MNLYNSLTRKKEAFRPAPKERVNLFVCGPTVYDYSHLGHARTYLSYDAMVKFMRKKLEWDVFYLQNITDIDDRIIDRAKENNEAPKDLADRFEKIYHEDMNALGIDSVNKYAPATEYIPEIISQVERLIKKGAAYKINDDGYYFDISKFKDYGKLAGRTVEQAEDSVSRIDESVDKKNKGDFALWKFSKEDEPSWPSSLGEGRPGWHIEDTAIAEKYFGFTYHIHGGAIDLKFPHHEAEIAQMESLSGVKPMVKIWVHTGFLTIDGKKMSKSLGNFLTIRDILGQSSPQTLRMVFFSAHYRSPLDYTEGLLGEAATKIDRLQGFVRKLGEIEDSGSSFPYQEFADPFWSALKDDFNTPKAFAILFDLMGEANKFIDSHTLSKKDAQNILDFVGEVNGIFNIIKREDRAESVPEEISLLTEEREKARDNEDFKKADEIREEIKQKGYNIEDTPKGPRIYKISG